MKIVRLLLISVVACLASATSYGQDLKIIGKPVASAFPFARIIAEKMKLNPPDSAGTKSNTRIIKVKLTAAGNPEKWVIIDFNKNIDVNPDEIKSVSITGSVSDIIDLYAQLYDESVRKTKPEDIYTYQDKEGEIRRIRTDYKDGYNGEVRIFGRISISKSTK
ncbi:hypothetical protein [Chitinophaga tropicalis]|uniref:Beta-lactamase-inhibitor-like PepSY-like domain-containing protein n=1 Tax=Chitinophaga tropicalis TaxID=2683588 RepID=A0A7K1U6B7_9BACT|nr:hypothetical protein [Chitinophaga tropicalis]MVT09890.1 hypothetical protein [Chitinophaga tropicalis]